MAPHRSTSSRPDRPSGANRSGGAGAGGSKANKGRSSGQKPGGRDGASGKDRAPSSGRQGSSRRPSAKTSGDGRGGSGRPTPTAREEPRTAGPKQWGSLGRKGAGRLTSDEFDARDSVGATGRDERPDPGNRAVEWHFVEEVRSEATGAVRRGTAPNRAPKPSRGRAPRAPGAGTGGADARAELQSALGAARGAKANDRLRDAAQAFSRERYEEARVLLRPLADQAPGAPSVRELYGLTLYRLGRWKLAVKELEAFRTITDSTEQHPVLADCYRALGRHRDVEALWDELREASPSADLVAEGRIVMAGSLADRGQLASAITLLDLGARLPKRPAVHHLRQAYALGDLYEAAGDAARARELFRWIVSFEPEFVDAAERASSLG